MVSITTNLNPVLPHAPHLSRSAYLKPALSTGRRSLREWQDSTQHGADSRRPIHL